MTPVEIAEIRAIAVRLAFEIYADAAINNILLTAETIFKFLVKND